MVETELKFQVPPAARAALRRAVATPGASTTRLCARYFDTADRRLAAAGVALRLRREGRVWVQTLKGPGAGLSRRLEHEVRLPAAKGVPTLDLGRHAGTPAAAVLQRALGGDAVPLALVFETDVRRVHRVLRVAGSRVELALDIGSVRGGGRLLPIWELEFELLRGPVAALYALATRWVQRHRLRLDVRTKAERGDLLSRGLAVSDPAGAPRPALKPDMTVDEAMRTMLRAALAQVLPNAAALAGGVGQDEHLHQLRVGLRRLRSVLKLFGNVPDGAGAQTVEGAAACVLAANADALAALFRRLGGARDRDVLATTLLPALAAAGGPPLVLPEAPPHEDVGAVLREAPVVSLLLACMAAAEEPGPAPDEVADDAADAGADDGAGDNGERHSSIVALARRRLGRLDRRLARAAKDFRVLDDEQRHRLRRQIKRLRYGVEATQALWPARACKRYLAGLRPMQEALGAYNDLQMAEAWLSREAGDEATGFARGWLAARRQPLLDAAAEALRRWPAAPKAWRRR